jgi:hypothetical protein
MRRGVLALAAVALLAAALAGSSAGRDRPFSTANLKLSKLWYPSVAPFAGQTSGDGQFSKVQIERFRCASSGNPAAAVDISCNTTEHGQDWAPDNEIAVAVNPYFGDNVVAGSNDYFYRFNNSTGARQALVPTGFFTSFDGGSTWVDGQIPLRSGNGAGDPAPAFSRRHSSPVDPHAGRVLMAQLENTGGLSGPFVSQGDVSVSYSADGGVTWSEPVTVMHGTGAGIGFANRAKFYDKEWLTCDNVPTSNHYGRCYLTATLFLNDLHGAYASSDIVISWSDDGGVTWTAPKSIAAVHPSCSYQETGPAGSLACDENQFSIPEVGADGTLYIHFLNGQNEPEWEVPFDFDSQIMVMRSSDGGQTFAGPFQVAQLEDGLSDMPFSVIGRQTVWGHQIRWASAGTITAHPQFPTVLAIVWSERGTPNPNATEDCFVDSPGDPPEYDPCNAGPSSEISIYASLSLDSGEHWTPKTQLDASNRHQWFPWADFRPDGGALAVAYDEDLQTSGTEYPPPPANDTFGHMLWVNGSKTNLSPAPEQIDISATHWAGQYVPPPAWPRVCGPVGYTDTGVADATGKDCNVFHGDYTGLAYGPDGAVNVVWTGLNRLVTTPQIDPYTGALHDGYAQDAMYARR